MDLSCLPLRGVVVVVVFAIAIAIRHRWFLYIGAELMVWPLFPFLFLLSLLSLSLLCVYLWTKCANNNVNSHYHKERLASFGLSRPDSVTSFGGKLRDKRTCAFGFFVA